MAETQIKELLNRPIDWKSYPRDRTVRHMLDNLQANIVKGHGRDHTRNLFFSFADADINRLRLVIHQLARRMPSALEQLVAAERFRLLGEDGGPVLCFFLRPSGYQALGAQNKAPIDAAFTAGMQARGPANLHDPAVNQWDPEFRGRIDAMLLVAHGKIEVDEVAGHWKQQFANAGAKHLVTVKGAAIRREVAGKMEGVEHFGYVDGRSQPLFLTEDVEREPRAHWDPAFPPSQFLIDDPGDDDPTSLGSLFVFRKLEQNVEGFKKQETALAKALDLPPIFKERAGALIVGRFEDGTPVVTNPLESGMPPVNDFNYEQDIGAGKCPFMAHIRKTNPRGESPLHLATEHPEFFPNGPPTVLQERSHIMARRGITYGERVYNPTTNDFDDEPMKDVGLLFMAYMRSVEDQFEFTQASWANNSDFVKTSTGVDPVIGQSTGPFPGIKVEDGWSGKVTAENFTFAPFVTLKGGEYFFAPCLRVLRHI